MQCSAKLFSTFSQIGDLDVASGLRTLSKERGWITPVLNEGYVYRTVNLKILIDSSSTTSILELRHPLVEDCISNDVQLDDKKILFLTGCNMSGKSTIMKSLAWATVLAQIGADIPGRGTLGIVDHLYIRVII